MTSSSLVVVYRTTRPFHSRPKVDVEGWNKMASLHRRTQWVILEN